MCLVIPLLADLLKVPALGIVERGADVDIVEERQRCRDGYRMLDTVLHLFERLLRENLRLGGVHRVGHLHRIAHLNLLVPACLAHRLLALEGVEARNVEGNRG